MDAKDLLDFDKVNKINKETEHMRHGRSAILNGVARYKEETRDNNTLLQDENITLDNS